MFAEIVPQLQARGWRSPIPIKPSLKKPAIHGWQKFSTRPPSAAEFAKWMKIYWNYGTGLVFGLDGTVGVDLDFVDPATAAKAEDIRTDILGATPLVRIGRPPKKLALYRYDRELVIARAYGGFELFTRSGQCVIDGVHPETRRPYRWLDGSPMTLGPGELPFVSRDQIHALITALEKLDRQSTARHRARRAGARRGVAAEILRVLPHGDAALAAAAQLLAATPKGRRHNSMLGAVVALAMRGFPDRIILATLSDSYSTIMDDELTWEAADDEIANAVRWAREHIGADDEQIANELAPAIASITAAWNRRWGRTTT